MSPNDHYERAEVLLIESNTMVVGSDLKKETIARAQVHAILATTPTIEYRDSETQNIE